MFKEFRKFILRGNVVDLAVGVIIGAAFNSVVQSLVNMITQLMPTKNGSKFSTAHFFIFGKDVIYGPFITALISFLLVAAIVFFFVVQPINKLTELSRSKKETEESSTKKCEFCLNVIPSKASRCGFCTSKLEVKKAEA
ncbi:large conductance mechanosensitive channel protein MscL [Candidatus Saccharibacteria bacterium]|nr:large conductance mechanosensitive channel protein MscL [Candidatus Saccharibacteria bacterium]